jgi:hypothetical protein
MNISIEEQDTANELVSKFLKYKDILPYANIGVRNEYLGWVADFQLKDSKNNTIKLDLSAANDLFLLFVLAVVWSRTGQWENSAFFVSYLKTEGKDSVSFWIDESEVQREEDARTEAALNISRELTGHKPRKKVSFRRDIYTSIHLLAKKWSQILQKLEESENAKDFEIFMEYIRNIEGLGVGQRKMLIKIPLVLRELKCQGIYENISGDFCCVPDARVYDAGKSLNIKIPTANNLDNLKVSSTKIYRLFGDLYDLPLFAYEDLKNL